MKVLVTIPCLLTGGTEIQTLSLVEALVAAGHDVTVAVYFEYSSAMKERYEKAGARVELLSPNGVRPNGVRATVWFLWRELRRVVKEVKPDVAHVQYMAPGAIPIVILKFLGLKRIVATAHTSGDIYSPGGLKLVRFLTQRVLNGFQCITLRAERSFFGEASLFDGTPKKHFTIYNTLPSHIEIRCDRRVFDKDKVTVGIVSRLTEIKGTGFVIPAFIKARKINDQLKLLIVGDGDLREFMEKQAIESGFSGDIKFVGLKSQPEIQQWYDQIDILLMPSRSEGFGLTAIEGMARGSVPVVADIGGLPEVVHRESGLLHKPGNITDMADKIMSALSYLEILSAGAIARAGDFSRNRYFEAIRNLYESL